jgi:hypothetical protein
MVQTCPSACWQGSSWSCPSLHENVLSPSQFSDRQRALVEGMHGLSEAMVSACVSAQIFIASRMAASASSAPPPAASASAQLLGYAVALRADNRPEAAVAVDNLARQRVVVDVVFGRSPCTAPHRRSA